MNAVYVNGLSLIAPGLAGWRQSLPILRGMRPYQAEELAPFASSLLPANERRRVTRIIKLALQAAQEALEDTGLTASQMGSVFASSSGDCEIIDKLCTALTLAERPVSPTHFHNSVHNAPAGYWAIATACALPSTSLSAYDYSFSAGLLEAAAFVAVEDVPVLLVAYDYPAPFPLSEVRRLCVPCATAIQLSPVQTASSLSKLSMTLASHRSEDHLDDAGLERLRTGNPAARSLPLLQALAKNLAGPVVLPYAVNRQLIVELASCL